MNAINKGKPDFSIPAFIQQVGMLLELPNLTICTAVVFFHRFYAVCSPDKDDPIVSTLQLILTHLFVLCSWQRKRACSWRRNVKRILAGSEMF